MFLHCYHYFGLGGLRISTEKNCKMEVIKIRGFLFCIAEGFMEFTPLRCDVSILTAGRDDKQKMFPKSCRLLAYSDVITVWRQEITNI